jgi:signal transduction histidine kinase
MLARDVSELARVQGAIALPRGAPRLAELVESLNATAHDLGQGLANMKRITEAILSSLREREAARARLDLRRVVQSAITICRTTVEERAMLRVELPPEEVPLVASEGKLLQLTINLLLNAAQSIPGGGLPVQHLVRLELRSEATGISLAVEDSGCGIPAEKREVIFQPFFTTKGAQGTGLGLAICKQIVEEMAGSISVESMPGRGSRFLVKLPPPVL